MQPTVYLVSNAVHMYAVYILFTAVLGKSKLHQFAEILTYIVYYLINCGVYLFMDNIMLNLISNILPMFVIMLQYKKPIQTYIFLTIGVCAVGMFFDWMFTCINPNFVLIKSNAPQSISFLGFVFLFRYCFKREEKVIVYSEYIGLLIIISAGTIMIGELSGPDYNVKSFLISVILLIINFLNFYLYDKYIENMQMKIMFNAVESSNQAYKNQIQLMNESQKKIRLLKHDMKNHLLKLKYDLENGNYTKADEYINNMTNNLITEKEFVNTGNIDFDCLLNYKLSIANEMNVVFSCHIVLPEELQVNSFDLTVILGNLLDNALNALKEAKVKQLNIDINYSIGMIVIKIENTFANISNKYDDPEKHGYGLISVRTSLEKYNGKLQNNIVDDKYVVKAVLYNVVKKS